MRRRGDEASLPILRHDQTKAAQVPKRLTEHWPAHTHGSGELMLRREPRANLDLAIPNRFLKLRTNGLHGT